jgi:hypothetical protein
VVPWADIVIRVPESVFVAKPGHVVRQLREIKHSDREARRAAMHMAAKELGFRHDGGATVLGNMLMQSLETFVETRGSTSGDVWHTLHGM